MRVLVVGGSGFLGYEVLRRAVAAGWDVAATYRTRPEELPPVTWYRADLRDPGRMGEVLARTRPAAVINASSGHADWAVTADGAARLALEAARAGCRLVHVSSDAVFSGADVHYPEEALPDPVSPYGAAKAAAETAVRVAVPEAAVVRTSLIVGHNRSAHEEAVHALAAGRRAGVLFTDDVRCPVHVDDLASALLEIAASDGSGVFHVAGPDAMNRHELGVLIARRDGLDPARLPAGLRSEVAPPGNLDIRLVTDATRARLRTRLRGAREFLGPGVPVTRGVR
ncbi:SDR family oxidoreductase [Streptomyces viridosporus]|uniref:NAD-dependent epimerase/dehydratase family protein n=1 Tax=Streptomyces viridosporus T7A TaxID=665577 RepID=A0ABX6AL51_STRVD|nr:sugar nucleotide-binding protein [Streptomyces viridosporus]QEU88593.1 NAD-dependent epimerase/dehydratase family protein [Streptomyces viridosporus T7A]